jgi:hypothetical protein
VLRGAWKIPLLCPEQAEQPLQLREGSKDLVQVVFDLMGQKQPVLEPYPDPFSGGC